MSGKPLETVIADWLDNAQAFRRAGQNGQADLVERFAADVSKGAEDFLRRLTEDEAMNWSGKSREWLRVRFAGWESDGHAWRDGRRRLYRAVVIPRRVNLEAIREDARREAAA